ncbi:hypothetical protein BT69DRAFT_1158668 [Atractiella rhizophila]|nr:hypothetical protein BT69DRAFT_1158668 [Atractiella rhizophila]
MSRNQTEWLSDAWLEQDAPSLIRDADLIKLLHALPLEQRTNVFAFYLASLDNGAAHSTSQSPPSSTLSSPVKVKQEDEGKERVVIDLEAPFPMQFPTQFANEHEDVKPSLAVETDPLESDEEEAGFLREEINGKRCPFRNSVGPPCGGGFVMKRFGPVCFFLHVRRIGTEAESDEGAPQAALSASQQQPFHGLRELL